MTPMRLIPGLLLAAAACTVEVAHEEAAPPVVVDSVEGEFRAHFERAGEVIRIEATHEVPGAVRVLVEGNRVYARITVTPEGELVGEYGGVAIGDPADWAEVAGSEAGMVVRAAGAGLEALAQDADLTAVGDLVDAAIDVTAALEILADDDPLGGVPGSDEDIPDDELNYQTGGCYGGTVRLIAIGVTYCGRSHFWHSRWRRNHRHNVFRKITTQGYCHLYSNRGSYFGCSG